LRLPYILDNPLTDGSDFDGLTRQQTILYPTEIPGRVDPRAGMRKKKANWKHAMTSMGIEEEPSDL
jgi:hypothetical protein